MTEPSAQLSATVERVLAEHLFSAQAYYQRTDQWTAHCLATDCDWRGRGEMGGRNAAEKSHRAHVASKVAEALAAQPAADGLAAKVRELADDLDAEAGRSLLGGILRVVASRLRALLLPGGTDA